MSKYVFFMVSSLRVTLSYSLRAAITGAANTAAVASKGEARTVAVAFAAFVA